MIIKVKHFIMIWVCLFVILTSILICGMISTYKVEGAEKSKSVLEVEDSMISEVKIVEEEIEIKKQIDVYQFPFEVQELGTYSVKGFCKDCIENKKYSNMRGYEGVTAFADEGVLPEGSLIWVENVGILQVQTVYSDYDGVFIYFNNHSKVEEFGEQNLLIFEILE